MMNSEILQTSSDPISADGLQQLAAAIELKFRGRVRGLSLNFDGVGVVLSGDADSFYDKQLVQHSVMKTASLRIRSNRIVVA